MTTLSFQSALKLILMKCSMDMIFTKNFKNNKAFCVQKMIKTKRMRSARLGREEVGVAI
jgi:hypothetical protein